MQTRSILGLVYTINTLSDLGYDVASVLHPFGLKKDKLDPFSQIDRVLELKILTALLKDVDNPLIGLELGQRFALAGYGPFTMLLMTCQNAFEACKMAMQYQNMTYLFGKVSLDLKQNRARINIEPILLPTGVHRYLIDRDISGTAKLIEDILHNIGEKLQLREVLFPYPMPENNQQYQQILGCPVSFGHEKATLVMDSHYLLKRFPQSSPTALEYYKQQCDQMMTFSQADYASVYSNVIDYLNLFMGQMPGIRQTAQALGSSERTLRRKLELEGKRYQQCLDTVRQLKAENWLKDSTMSIAEIAERLGYQESAAFIHAFKRWTGTTPARFRKTTNLPSDAYEHPVEDREC